MKVQAIPKRERDALRLAQAPNTVITLIDQYAKERARVRRPIREGVQVTTPEGKIGVVTDECGGSDKIRVRLFMQGANGEQYQEVVFFRKELRRVAEEDKP